MKVKAGSLGFTLLEVLVALAIFATAAISVMRSASQHVNTVHYLEEKTFAAMVADNQLALVHLTNKPISAKSGTEVLAGTTWHWQISPVATALPYLQAFDVLVAAEQQTSPIVKVRSYVAKP